MKNIFRNFKGLVCLNLLCLTAMDAVANPQTATANSQTATAQFNVTAKVVGSCSTSVSASGLDFGNYTGTQLDGTTSIKVNCTNGKIYNIGLSAGTGTGATVTSRKMMNGSNTLAYALYRDSGRTQNWGETIGTDTFLGTDRKSVV